MLASPVGGLAIQRRSPNQADDDNRPGPSGEFEMVEQSADCVFLFVSRALVSRRPSSTNA